MANLYEINEDIQKTLDLIYSSMDEETGEVDESYVHQLDDLNFQRDEKIENIGCYYKNLLSDIEAFKNEEKVLKRRREILENKANSLKNYISTCLNGEKWDKSTKVAFSFRSSNKVVIDDESALPKEFLIKKEEFSPDKKAIKEAIDNGVEVKGAHIETNNNLQIK